MPLKSTEEEKEEEIAASEETDMDAAVETVLLGMEWNGIYWEIRGRKTGKKREFTRKL